MPEESARRPFPLTGLLAGDTRALAPLIGANYARKGAQMSQSAPVSSAACLGKSEHLPAIRALTEDPLVGPLREVGSPAGWRKAEKISPVYGISFPDMV